MQESGLNYSDMRTANEYRQKTVLSLKDEIKRLDGIIVERKEQISDLEAMESRRMEMIEILQSIEQQVSSAKSAHSALLKSLDAEEQQKEEKIRELEIRISNLETWNSREAANKSAEMIDLDLQIAEKCKSLFDLDGQENAVRIRIAQARSDEVQALNKTSAALHENKEALETLADIKDRINQAEKEWSLGEKSRADEVNSLKEWEKRLSRREEDFNVIVERMKPEYIQAFGMAKINYHIFNSSRPKK